MKETSYDKGQIIQDVFGHYLNFLYTKLKHSDFNVSFDPLHLFDDNMVTHLRLMTVIMLN